MGNIVEFQFLRPRAMTARRDAVPAAYIGLGILEWHGLQNPLGLDGVKANGVARHLAERLGGVVMPPQYWGDFRAPYADVEFDGNFQPDFSYPENHFDHTPFICEYMGITRETYLKDTERSRQYGEWDIWEKLMVRTLFEIETYGFKAIILLPGHFHLIAASDRAMERYYQEGGQSKVLNLNEFAFTKEDLVGDHAAAFETSLMMSLCPELVDMNELDSDLSKPNIGVIGLDPRVHASKEFGDRILDEYLLFASAFLKENGIIKP